MATAKKQQKRQRETFSWLVLQDKLRDCETSDEVSVILADEIAGPARLRWLMRINGRLQALRNAEEVAYLESIAKG